MCARGREALIFAPQSKVTDRKLRASSNGKVGVCPNKVIRRSNIHTKTTWALYSSVSRDATSYGCNPRFGKDID
jgi:hypothetical protein